MVTYLDRFESVKVQLMLLGAKREDMLLVTRDIEAAVAMLRPAKHMDGLLAWWDQHLSAIRVHGPGAPRLRLHTSMIRPGSDNRIKFPLEKET